MYSFYRQCWNFVNNSPEGPIIIHCKDGAGISGVLYTVYKSIKDSTEKGSIDIFHTVKKLRNERMNSVSTLVSCGNNVIYAL